MRRYLTKKQLLDRVNSFEYWHYPFDFGNGIIINPDHAQEKRHLKNFIWPAVIKLCGGSLEGLRVIDLGCNAGFWSLEAHKSGAAYVLGIDARSAHIEQAQLVRDALGINPEKLEYRQMSIYDLTPERIGEYDLCLLLRLLQHLRHPLLALERVREICRDYLIVDIKMVRLDWPVLYLHDEDPEGLLEGNEGVAFKPSKSAVQLMLKRSGFRDVKIKRPRQPLEGAYFTGKRGVFTARVARDKGSPRL